MWRSRTGTCSGNWPCSPRGRNITEELTRLASHLDQFKLALDEDGEVGRRLDFLVQEMAREANTTSAKSGDTEISKHCVDLKVELDRLEGAGPEHRVRGGEETPREPRCEPDRARPEGSPNPAREGVPVTGKALVAPGPATGPGGVSSPPPEPARGHLRAVRFGQDDRGVEAPGRTGICAGRDGHDARAPGRRDGRRGLPVYAREEFLARVARGEFLEYATVHGNRTGPPAGRWRNRSPAARCACWRSTCRAPRPCAGAWSRRSSSS